MNSEIGKKIKQLRKQQKITQAKLGELIGKKEVTIRKYENGSIEIPLNVLQEISENLNTSVAELLNIDPQKTIYSPELGIIARKMHTHYDYVAGKTKDKILTRYDFNETLNILNFSRFEKNINHYSAETQAAIFGMFNTYLSTALIDWYFSNNKMSNYELDTMFINTLILDKINSYKNDLFDKLIEIEPNDSTNFILREPTSDDLIAFSRLKTDVLNFISKLLDDLITTSFSNEDKSLFEEELKSYFGDSHFKYSKKEGDDQCPQDTP